MTRLPDGQFSTPEWALQAIRSILQEAADRAASGHPIKLIFQISDGPDGVASSDLATLTTAVKAFVGDIYSQLSPLTSQVSGFEFGNEPNEYFSGAYRNSGADFADYINAMSAAVSSVETAQNVQIPFIVGGIVYNHTSYMQDFFARLGKNAIIDGFALHPYTLPTTSEPTSTSTNEDLASRRPTEWSDPTTPGDLNDFQKALSTMQHLMNANGYGDKTLSITEVGVPSWLGARNAGADGRDDQARWIAESVGVLESWDNRNLNALIFHATLDYALGSENDAYNVYDQNPSNNNDGLFGESAFGLFERKTADGPVQAKAAAYVLEALRGHTNLNTTLFPEAMADVLARLRIVIGQGEGGVHDVSTRAAGTGITNGYIILAQGGDDTVKGSAFNDVIFAGDGNDLVDGNDGADRLYGGAGNDTLNGGAGDDDLYGNTGNDVIDAGAGTNRVDGGTGDDWLVLTGSRSDYTITGDGVHVTITGLGTKTEAYNIERLVFMGDGTTTVLANGDVNRGNGLTEANAGHVNHRATIVPASNQVVVEDTGAMDGVLSLKGQLSIIDADSGENAFRTTVFRSADTLGTLVLNKDGTFTYQVSNAATQYLKAGEHKVELFTVTSVDGTSTELRFEIIGTDDAAVIGTPSVAMVNEASDPAATVLEARGTISISDADKGENGFLTNTLADPGNLGTLTIAADGSYVYSVARDKIAFLNDGETRVDHFTITSLGGTTKNISFTINGSGTVKTAAMIGDPSQANVTEDKNVVDGQLVASGTIGLIDPDAGENRFLTTVIRDANALGSLILNADGTYTYSVDNAKVQALAGGEHHIDTFTISAADGTTKNISFDVTGVNDAATFGTPTNTSVTEDVGVVDGLLTASGTITTSDIDRGETGFRTTVISAATNLGTLTISADGHYTYSISNSAVQSLGTGQSRTETFTLTALDGTTKEVSFVVNGADEPIPETLYQDLPGTQWLTGTTSKDVFVINAASTDYHSGISLDGKSIVVWNGTKFDILTGFETIRFTDRDVNIDAKGRFIIAADDAKHYETLYQDQPQTQWVTGASGNDVFVYNTSSANFFSARTADGLGIVVWNGTKFDILTGFEGLRFTDKEVRLNANGIFDIPGTPSTLVPENIVQNVAEPSIWLVLPPPTFS